VKKRVADIIMEILCENDITDCFAVVGGGAMHLDNALAICDGINKYFNHHEQACAMAAEAYARLSGKMAAVFVTSGPGGTNTLTGIMGAWQDSLPVLVISGQVRYETSIEKSGLSLRYRGMQEFDIVNSIKNMTKYNMMIKDPLSIKKELQKAIDIAISGRRGPVWIDVPLDIQSAIIEEEDLYPVEISISKLPSVSNKEIEFIIDTLENAKRPCILAGSGIRSSNTMKEFLEFVELFEIPVIGGAWVADIMYDDHQLYYGLSGNIGPRTGNFILQNADVILTLGNSLGFRQTGFNQEDFVPNAKIIMVDVDENEPKKPGLNIFKFIHSDLYLFFEKAARVENKIRIQNEWKEYCDKLKNKFTPFESIKGISMNERVSACYFWKKFQENEANDSILALGNNTGSSFKLQIGVKQIKQRVLTNYTCGSMGYDLPAAIGAAVVAKKEVICVTGDGSIMMNLQELQTIKQYNLPIKIVIFSNDGYGAIRQTCKNFFNSTFIGCTADSGVSFPDFRKISEAFECDYMCCNNNSEVENSLNWLFMTQGFALLEVKQRFDDSVSPKVMSRMNENGTFSTPALHDMAPFLEKDELDSLMLW
jgi:acetolactate synthase-1/2/3 large subunit